MVAFSSFLWTSCVLRNLCACHCLFLHSKQVCCVVCAFDIYEVDFLISGDVLFTVVCNCVTWPVAMFLHASTLSRTRTRTYAHTHTHTHTHMRARAYFHIHMRTYLHIHARWHARAFVQISDLNGKMQGKVLGLVFVVTCFVGSGHPALAVGWAVFLFGWFLLTVLVSFYSPY